jgi:hypothetical protein
LHVSNDNGQSFTESVGAFTNTSMRLAHQIAASNTYIVAGGQASNLARVVLAVGWQKCNTAGGGACMFAFARCVQKHASNPQKHCGCFAAYFACMGNCAGHVRDLQLCKQTLPDCACGNGPASDLTFTDVVLPFAVNGSVGVTGISATSIYNTTFALFIVAAGSYTFT